MNSVEKELLGKSDKLRLVAVDTPHRGQSCIHCFFNELAKCGRVPCQVHERGDGREVYFVLEEDV